MSTAKRMLFASVALAAAVACGVLAAGIAVPRPAAAQADRASSLPPIFREGNTVTFGPQGPNLTILQIHGDWIYVSQVPIGGTLGADTDDSVPDEDRFWVYVPAVREGWRQVVD